MELVEYAAVLIQIGTDLEDLNELENHLSMNGYNFGFDRNRNLLFVSMDEFDYVETILHDRRIVHAALCY